MGVPLSKGAPGEQRKWWHGVNPSSCSTHLRHAAKLTINFLACCVLLFVYVYCNANQFEVLKIKAVTLSSAKYRSDFYEEV